MLTLRTDCIVFFLYVSIIYVPNGKSATIDEADSLHAHLISGYNKYVRPVKDQNNTLVVNITLGVVAIQEFDEILEKFSVVGVFLFQWVDERMVWNETEYGGIETVFTGYKDVWIPEAALLNPSAKIDSFGKEWQLIHYRSNGLGSWFPGDIIKTSCSLNVRYYPFDIQECDINVYVWAYSVKDVRFKLPVDYIDTTLMSSHGSWTIIGTQVGTSTINGGSVATFTFKLKRKPQYIIINIVLPILFLSLLNSFVFVLPAESGDRISYAITVLLSIAVFMTIVSDTLPKHSEPLSLFSYFMMYDLIMSSLITLVVILNLQLFYKQEDPIPAWLRNLYHLLNCSRCKVSKKKQTVFPNNEINHPNKTAIVKCQSMQISEHDIRLKDVQKTENINYNDTSPRKVNMDDTQSGDAAKAITWQQISVMVDCLAFILSFILTVIKIILFCTLSQMQ